MDLASNFHTLFRGLKRAHGIYELTNQTNDKGKEGGKARTVIAPVTEELWTLHLQGKQGLGIVPIRDDAQCYFGAIDVDEYNLDLKALEADIVALELPVFVLRSKSGGAHVYTFTKEPVPASLLRDKLQEWAQAIGHPSSEIFPKQIALAGEDDVGNWINMPYFDSSASTRYWLHRGSAMSAEDFLEAALPARLTLEQLRGITVKVDERFEDAPPCIQTMVRHSIPDGMRNKGLFAFGVFAKLSSVDESWPDKVSDYNGEFCVPPLPYKEVDTIIKSLARKTYFYPCKDQPCCLVCNKQICRTRKYGITNGDDPGVTIESLTKILTETPMWVVEVQGQRIKMTTDDLINQRRFHKRCVEAVNFHPRRVKDVVWEKMLNDRLADRREIEAPPDAGPHGQFMYHFSQFLTSRPTTQNRDELLLGKILLQKERVFFRSPDLFRYLDQQKFRDLSQPQVWSALRDLPGTKHEQLRAKGTCVQCWSVPEDLLPTIELDEPRIPAEERLQ